MAENEKSTQNVEMETELLGSLFLKDGLVIPDVAAILKPNDFYYSVHQIIYQIILDFHSRGVVPSLISTWEEMQKHKHYEISIRISTQQRYIRFQEWCLA